MADTEYKIIRPAINPRRWNTQNREDGLYVCRGLHDKNEVCDFEKITADIWHHVTEVIRERDKVEQLYDQLLYAVGKVYKSESRHETALRYITQAEMIITTTTEENNDGGDHV